MKKTKARNEAAPGREGAGGIVGRKVEAHRCSPILSGYKVTGATSDIRQYYEKNFLEPGAFGPLNDAVMFD